MKGISHSIEKVFGSALQEKSDQLLNSVTEIRDGIHRFSSLVAVWQDYIMKLEEGRNKERDILLTQIEALVVTSGVSLDNERHDISIKLSNISDRLERLDEQYKNSLLRMTGTETSSAKLS